MARKPRVEFEGVLYTMDRAGKSSTRYFRDQRDRVAYLDRLERLRGGTR